MMRFAKFKSWLAAVVVLGLAACGGGGGSGGTPVLGGSTTTPPAANALQIKFSATSVDNTGTQNVTATVTALDANGKTVSGVPIALKIDNNATLTVQGTAGSTTGTSGTLAADVTIGNDYSIRKITLTASSGTVSTTGSFDVVGSKQAASDLTLAASPSIPNLTGSSVTVTATAVDANRNALAAIPVTFSVDSGATISPSGTATGAQGTVTGALRIGADQSNRDITVTATSGTVVRQLKVKVVGAALSVSQLAPTITTSAAAKLTYVLQDSSGSRMAAYPITVTTSSGFTSSGSTDSSGEFVFNFQTPATAQALTVTAKAAGVTVDSSTTVTATAVVPAAQLNINSGTLSVSPQSVAVNTGTSTANKVEVRALFLSASNAPIPNVRVWFDLDGDKQSIGGTLASKADRVLLYSDANGIARTTYAPGTRFSPKDGVTVRVCYDKGDFAIPAEGGACPNQAKATLTVSSESLSVTIGTNGTLEIGDSGLTYVKRYVVQVVDSAGQAKAGVTISPSVDLLNYFKGQWTVNLAAARWEQGGLGNSYPGTYPISGKAVSSVLIPSPNPGLRSGQPTVCANEDLNRNGVAEVYRDVIEGNDVDEDQNGSGLLNPARPRLDPRKADVSVTMVSTDQTNASGIAVVKIEYPQNLGSWIEFNLLVSASGVAGTEGRANFKAILPVLASAVTTINAEPAFRLSPYGTEASPTFFRQTVEGYSGWVCTNPN